MWKILNPKHLALVSLIFLQSAYANQEPLTCTGDHPFLNVDGTQCLSDCGHIPLSLDGTQCLNQCPRQKFQQEYNGQCSCIKNTFLDIDRRTCVEQCSSGSIGMKGETICKCPPQAKLISEDGASCLSQAECFKRGVISADGEYCVGNCQRIGQILNKFANGCVQDCGEDILNERKTQCISRQSEGSNTLESSDQL